MSDKELKELVAGLAIAQRELAASLQHEIAASRKEADERRKEADERRKEADERRKEADERRKEAEDERRKEAEDVRRKELDEHRKKIDERMAASRREVDKQIKQTQKQLGELGNKWGTFTEGMAIASIKKILFEKFNISAVSERFTKRMNGESIEMDAFGYENSNVNTAVIVEIKSHLRDDAAEQLERIMADFPKFFPDHADKKLYGIIACVHAPDSIKNLLRKKGIYLAVLHEDIFELYDFKNFTPKDFNHA